MEKYTLDQALEEANTVKKFVPEKNPTGRDYQLVNDDIDDLKRKVIEAETQNGKPLKEELINFVVTPEMRAEALRYFQTNKDYLIQMAIEEEGKAISHRNPPFQVGCVVLGIEPKHIGAHFGIYKGHNFTLKPGSIKENKGDDKRCAERMALKVAENRAKSIAVVLTVSREVDTGDGNRSAKALHPCKECRSMYRALTKEGLLSENTMICIVNNAGNKIISEERTLKELLDLYPEDLEKRSVL